MNDVLETGATGEGGEQTGSEQAWLTSVPESLRTNEAFKGIENASDAWQQFVDMKADSENTLRIPGEDSTDEDRAAFMNKLGRPETAEEYTIAKPEGLPEGVPYDENLETAFKGIFHENGIPDTAANALWGKYHEMVAEGHKQQQATEKEAYDTAVNSLKDEWTGDNFKVNTEIAFRAFSGVFEDAKQQEAATEFIKDTKINGLPIGDNPMFLKIFHQIGSIIGDDKLNQGRGDGFTSGLSDEDAAKKRFPNTKF